MQRRKTLRSQPMRQTDDPGSRTRTSRRHMIPFETDSHKPEPVPRLLLYSPVRRSASAFFENAPSLFGH